jgi:hypothetical protein
VVVVAAAATPHPPAATAMAGRDGNAGRGTRDGRRSTSTTPRPRCGRGPGRRCGTRPAAARTWRRRIGAGRRQRRRRWRGAREGKAASPAPATRRASAARVEDPPRRRGPAPAGSDAATGRPAARTPCGGAAGGGSRLGVGISFVRFPFATGLGILASARQTFEKNPPLSLSLCATTFLLQSQQPQLLKYHHQRLNCRSNSLNESWRKN